MMRNLKKAAYLCMVIFLLMTTGCSHSDTDSDVSTVYTIDFSDVDDADNQTDSAQLQTDSELDGNIESIADNSVVINKIFHPSANTAVSYTDDSEKVLITVYFSEETEFEVWTVKNNGVNGDTDVEKRQGAFSDLKQNAHINMTGGYEGDDFHAKHVIIHNYV